MDITVNSQQLEETVNLNLTDIKNLTKLESLSIGGNLTDISKIFEITNLKKLTINRNNEYTSSILNIEGIENLNNLEEFILNINTNNDIELQNVLTIIDSLDCKVNFGVSYYLDGKTIGEGTTKTISYNDIFIIKELMNETSKFYNPNLQLTQIETPIYYTDNVVVDNEQKQIKILAPEGDNGEYKTYLRVSENENNNTFKCTCTIEINWKTKTYSEDIVSFTDSSLKSAIISAGYDTNGDGELSEREMANITSLFLYNARNITSIEGLEYATNLTSLSIYGNNITDISALKNLTKLGFLNLSYNNITDISALNNLTNLTTLNLSGNNISNISALTNLINITDLYLNKNNITDITALAKFTKLTNLHLSCDSIIDISLLASLTNLTSLSLNGNITNIKGLNTLTNLTTLYLGSCNISDITPITNLTNLKFLSLDNNNIIDISLLEHLTNLTYLNLNNNKISDITPLENLEKLTFLDILNNPVDDIEENNSRVLAILRERNVNIDVSEFDRSENVVFEDENLKTAIINSYSYIDTNHDGELSKSEATNITSLYLYNANDITSAKGLECAINLTTLSIDNSAIEDISPLSTLTNLTDLRIFNTNGDCKIIDLSPIQNLTNLTNLSIGDNGYDSEYKISDISALEELTKITNLSLPNNNISDISVLENLTELTNLSVYNNQVSDTSILNNLRKLTNVYLNNQVIKLELGTVERDSIVEKELPAIFSQMCTEGNLVYSPNTRINKSNDIIEINESKTKVMLNTSKIGKHTTNIYYDRNGISDNIYCSVKLEINYSVIIEGDNTREITFEDENLKNALLVDYDLDEDGKITEYDMVNIGSLILYNKNISNLTGIENAVNCYDIVLDNNKVSDISPLMSLAKLEDAWLLNNNIYDITCIENRKFKYITALGLDNNYIDFSNNSENLKAYLVEMEKDIENYGNLGENFNSKEEGLALLTSFTSKQRYGLSSEVEFEVTMDSKIKQKLIELGADLNSDGKLTRQELYDATEPNIQYINQERIDNTIIKELDLSNLGLTNISGLEYLTELISLNLSNNDITDITPLSHLYNLNNLDLSNNNITDITSLPFYSFNQLAWYSTEKCLKINLSNNKINDISCMANWVRLKTSIYREWQAGGDPEERIMDIDLSNNKISDISIVKDFKTLRKLNLSNNKITDISFLKNYNFTINPECENSEYMELLDNFQGIDLSNNQIDISNVANVEAIKVFENKGVTLTLENQQLYVCGDLNSNDVADGTDLTYLGRYLNGIQGYKVTEETADTNRDGIIDWNDYNILKKHITGETGYELLPKTYTCGDINRDYVVDTRDISYLGKCLDGSYTAVLKVSDVNEDGEVDWKDYSILKKHIAGETGYELLPKTYTCGDINRDYVVNASDITYLGKYLNGNTNYPVLPKIADVNGDEEIDWEDYSILKKHIAGETEYETLPKLYECGDINRDYVINATDITYLGRNLNGNTNYSVVTKIADVNDDGQIDWKDYSILKKHIAKETGYETLPKPYSLGDINRDYVVNATDLTYLGRYLNGTNGYEVVAKLADINEDGQVDWADYKALKIVIKITGN